MKKNTLLPGMFFVLVLAVSLAPAAMATYTVLWDTSHGVLTGDGIDYDPSGYYSELSNYLVGNGDFSAISMTDELTGFTSANLDTADVAVVSVLSSYVDPYVTGSAELNDLEAFVFGGGGLLIMSERSNAPVGNISDLASLFGITITQNVDTIYTGYTDITGTDIPAPVHQIFEGVDTISLYDSSGFTQVDNPAITAATYGGKTAVAVAEYGQGRVVVIGDSTLWQYKTGANQEFYREDNEDFALNTFEYLAVPEPATLVILGIGGLVVTARKRSKQS